MSGVKKETSNFIEELVKKSFNGVCGYDMERDGPVLKFKATKKYKDKNGKNAVNCVNFSFPDSLVNCDSIAEKINSSLEVIKGRVNKEVSESEKRK